MKNYKINKKSILILGVTGQDGSLMAKYYLEKKFKVYGYLTTKKKNLKNLKKLKILKNIKLFTYEKDAIEDVIIKTKCAYIFFLSGVSSVTKSNLIKYNSIVSNSFLLIQILELLRIKNIRNIKILNASSSEIFGRNNIKNNENSEINPVSFYGLSKSISLEIAKAYRIQFGIKIFNAILFNHESLLRPKEYVIQKIVLAVKNIYLKKINKINLGNLEVSRDWGWAPEYVKIIYKIMNLKKADDFIIATGKNTKLLNIVKLIFTHYNLNYKKYVRKSKSFIRSYEIKKISANNNKLQKAIKYKPKILINEIIKKMINREN
jgi:GDPmannose 4,6-dehydratase